MSYDPLQAHVINKNFTQFYAQLFSFKYIYNKSIEIVGIQILIQIFVVLISGSGVQSVSRIQIAHKSQSFEKVDID